MLGVRVLGELTIDVDGREIEPPTSRRARSLLGLLAVDRRPHSRSQLAARFWPDVLDESARTSLRGALSALRRSLGPGADRYIVAARDTLALADQELIWTDLAEFDSLLAAGRLEDALALCRGELLEGLDDEWVYEARDEHRDRVAKALWDLAGEAEARGELRDALAFARRQAALDPVAEEPQRELIRLLAKAGDRAAALQAYRRLQDRLRSELGIAPSARTRELVESLRGAGQAVDAVSPDDAATQLDARRPSGTVTLLFTDDVSSTETLVALGDDEAERRRRIHFRLLREVAATHGGQEVKNLGDGLMVAFASAVDAVACAIGIQQAILRHAESEGETERGSVGGRVGRRAGGTPINVRVGLNVGEPIVDEGDYFGMPVVVARRLCDAARGGQILASGVVRSLVGTRGGFEFRSVGSIALKGLAEPTEAIEVCWEATTEQRIPLPPAMTGTDTGLFIGRAQTLTELERHWDAAVKGQRRVVLLGGEPGIGKTRLAAEFCQAAHAGGAAVLAGRCHEEMVTPFEPFAEALHHYLSALPSAELSVQIGQRRRELAGLVPDLGDGVPRLAGEALADPEQERFRLFEAVASALTAAARARPMILVLDDLHWADDASLLLLRHVVRATEGSRILIVGTYRQVELDPHGRLADALADLRRARALDQIVLDGLPESDVAELIAARSGAGAAEPFARQVAARTDGNPFFIEELLRHVEDPAAAELDDLELPDSVKDLLRRRLQLLGEDSLRALTFASVAGHEFDLVVLERVLGESPDDLAEVLERAVRAHVLVEETTPVGRYRFAHPLIRETIYGDVSLTRRTFAHRRVGEAIESLYAASLAEHAGSLALHFHAARDPEKAFDYHVLAASEAERGSAPETAFEHLTGAIAAGELLGRSVQSDAAMRELHRRRAWNGHFFGSPEVARRDHELALRGARAAGDRTLEMHLLNEIGTSFHVRDGATSARYHEHSLELAEELGDEAGQIGALNRLSLLYGNQLDLERALRLGERLLALAEAGQDEWAYLRAEDALKFVALMLADTDRLEQLTSHLTEALRRRDALWDLQWALQESAFTPIVRGRWAQAAGRIDEALAISRRLGDIHSRALILMTRCRLEQARGEYASALAAGEEAVLITAEGKGHVWHGWAAGALARVMEDLRAWPRALELLEGAFEAAEGLDARAQSFGVLGDLAWVRMRCGDRSGAQEAARCWDAMLESALRTPPGRAYLYWWHTYTSRAQAALALGDIDRAHAVCSAVREAVERSGMRDARAELTAVMAGGVRRGSRGPAGGRVARLRRAGEGGARRAAGITPGDADRDRAARAGRLPSRRRRERRGSARADRADRGVRWRRAARHGLSRRDARGARR
jgi:class 3 adenylate cyclase